MERYPISSQAFIPINGAQGVNYHSGTWQHPLIALEKGDYLVIDHASAGPGFNQDYEEVLFTPGELILQFPHLQATPGD